MTKLKNKNLPLVDSRALGKNPPSEREWGSKSDHYRQALIEAADELENQLPCKKAQLDIEDCADCKSHPKYLLAKKLRISAGVGKE